MKVFITGAGGFIGHRVVKDFVDHGYEVVGLARSDASADKVLKSGGKVLRGEIQDTALLEEAARESDGVVHLAFGVKNFNDLDEFKKATAADRAAITAMAEGMAGTQKPLLTCTGTLGYPRGQVSNEETEPGPTHGVDRDLMVPLTYSLSKEKGIKGMVMRLSPSNHGPGDVGFVPMLARLSRQAGFAPYIGDGSARWAATHVEDTALSFRLAFEKGRAGVTYLPVAEGAVLVKDMMTAIASKIGVPVISKTPQELMQTHGEMGFPLAADTPVDSSKTKAELGWVPQQVGLVEDIEKNYDL